MGFSIGWHQMKRSVRFRSAIFVLAATFAMTMTLHGQEPPAGYLFAHMTKSHYGGLYYAISSDGLTWESLNHGELIKSEYRGHPDICKGHDGRYYMIGVESGTKKLPIWVSTDLLSWAIEGYIPLDLFLNYPDTLYKAADGWHGAPKLFWDDTEGMYIITWHAPSSAVDRQSFANYWCSMRTFYITSSDLKAFTRAARLFPFEMGTIDVIIRKEGGLYYAFLKDECEATAQWPTGKSIRVSVSTSLTGPYSYPSAPISPSYHEAPSVIPKPDGTGWYVYYEQYPGIQFGVSEAPAMAGPWFKVWGNRIKLPDGVRHGCIIPLSAKEYNALLSRYGYDGAPDDKWLFASFKDPGNEGIWFALSDDALTWEPLNGDEPWIRTDSVMSTMRDPYITRGVDNVFHMVWTCGRHKIGYSRSTDLVEWTAPRVIPVDRDNEKVQNTWAPELFFDRENREWIIFWSSTVDDMFHDTEGQVENNRNHRIFCMRTVDFEQFSAPELFYDPGYPVIDATLMQTGDSVLMVFKDERRWPLHKQMRSTMAKSIQGKWSEPGEPVTPPWTEGPSLIKKGEEYILFYDSYREQKFMGAVKTTNLLEWVDISDKVSFPPRYKHGSFLRISNAEALRLSGKN
jgi:hypothetical protein